MANVVYNTAKERLMKATFNWETVDLRVLLITNGYTVDADDIFVDALTPGSNELSGTGYARLVLASKAVTKDDTNDRAEGDAADVLWTGIDAGTAQAAILFVQVTNDADSWLVCYIDTGGFPITTNGGDLTIQWNAEGILQLA